MQLTLDNPDYRYICRGVGPSGIWVNNRELSASFLLAPNQLLEDWALRDLDGLDESHWQPVIELRPTLFLFGTGDTQIFPESKHLAYFLQRGIGFEIMNNAAAARTFNILANEGRNIVAGFVLP